MRENIPLIERYSAMGKIIRITAYIFKAIPILLKTLKKGAKKLEVKTEEILGSLTPKLLTEATNYLTQVLRARVGSLKTKGCHQINKQFVASEPISGCGRDHASERAIDKFKCNV